MWVVLYCKSLMRYLIGNINEPFRNSINHSLFSISSRQMQLRYRLFLKLHQANAEFCIQRQSHRGDEKFHVISSSLFVNLAFLADLRSPAVSSSDDCRNDARTNFKYIPYKTMSRWFASGIAVKSSVSNST